MAAGCCGHCYPWPWGRPRHQLAARIGQSFAFLFVLFGLFYSRSLLVGIFVYFAATSEEQASSLRWMARGLTVADAMERKPRLLRTDEPLARAVDALLETPQRDFPVVDAAGCLSACSTAKP